MRIYEILGWVMVVALFTTGFTFGVDRELARRDFVKGEKAVGCIYTINCDYYNNKGE
jgi:hypothetical protein